MTDVTAARVLDLWERAAAVAPAARGVALLAGRSGATAIETEPLGRRDQRLSALRQELRGSDVEGLARCPACGEEAELHFDLRDMFADAPTQTSVDVVSGEWTITCRPLTTADLLAVVGRPEAADQLMARSVVKALHLGQPADALDAPIDVREAVAASVAGADPLADVELALTCPACRHEWRAPFDVTAFVWDEIDHDARELLRDIDELARAYGWREPDILALSPWRRRRYLEMVRG